MASSITQAREGTLYLMIGGKQDVFEGVKDLLNDLSISLRFVGEAGRAAQVKALVNMVMNINTAALAEGLGIGDALGLDLKMLCEIFSQTGANSRVLETDAEDMLTRDHECYFSADHAAKDSGIAIAVAEEAGVNVPLAKATLAQFQKMVELGLGELDKSGVAELTFKGRGAGNYALLFPPHCHCEEGLSANDAVIHRFSMSACQVWRFAHCEPVDRHGLRPRDDKEIRLPRSCPRIR
jgi:hypothetical protein